MPRHRTRPAHWTPGATPARPELFEGFRPHVIVSDPKVIISDHGIHS